MARVADAGVRKRWERLIQLQQASDLTVADFCAEQGVSPASLYQWRRRLAGEADRPGQFVAVDVVDGPAHEHVSRTGDSEALPTIVRFTCGTELQLQAGDYTSLIFVLDRLAGSGRRSEP